MLKMQTWSTRDEQDRRSQTPGAVHAGVQAGGGSSGQGGPGDVGDGQGPNLPKATLGNWVRMADKGQLQGAGDRPVSAEQMELARLRAELARVKMERDILKNRCEVRLD